MNIGEAAPDNYRDQARLTLHRLQTPILLK